MSRRIKWAGHVARMGEEKNCTGLWWEILNKGDHSEDRGIWDNGIRIDLWEII
jgi:hypothetical protein